jgi:hypothetical protein
MNPSPAKGKARRKPCTEKPSARFDEEVEVERPLLYSTTPAYRLFSHHSIIRAICIQNHVYAA